MNSTDLIAAEHEALDSEEEGSGEGAWIDNEPDITATVASRVIQTIQMTRK